jgi:hypothetical protein
MRVVHGRTGGRLKNYGNSGVPWEDHYAFCGQVAKYPKTLLVVEIGSPSMTCKKCIAKVEAISGRKFKTS